MRNEDYKMYEDNYLFDHAAIPLLIELHDFYGERFLSIHLGSDEVIHTVEKMEKIKKEMDDQFIVSVCATYETVQSILKIDMLFPNLHLMYDYYEIIEMILEKEWLNEFAIMNYKVTSDFYRCKEKTLYTKGENWDKCPQHIKDFFLYIKDQGKIRKC